MTARSNLTSEKPLDAWRSMIYVPVNVARFVDKAHLLDVDAIQLDLEDSISGSEKEHARTLVAEAAAKAARGGADVIVRINQPLHLAVRDIEASVGPHVMAFSLPKVLGPDHVRLLSEHTAHAENLAGITAGSTRFIVIIETPQAWFGIRDICKADPRIIGVMLGGEDFSAATGMATSAEVMAGPKQMLVLAAAEAGIVPYGMLGSIADLGDMEQFRAMVRQSRAFGFRGASCVHPRQAAVLNEEFCPSDTELVWARETLAAYELGVANAAGAVAHAGRMIDLPVASRAQAILDWQERILARRRARQTPAGE